MQGMRELELLKTEKERCTLRERNENKNGTRSEGRY